MMIFPGNHDTERIGDIVAQDPAKMKIVYTLMSTLRGFPQIFAGDELMVVSRDRSQGHGGLRVEFPLEWEQNPVMKDLHDTFRTLFTWRKTSTAVQQGRTVHFLRRDNTYAYFRIADAETFLVFVNNSLEEKEISWGDYEEITVNLPSEARDVLTSETMKVGEKLVLGPRTAKIIEFK